MDSIETSSPTKFSAAVQITRPKSASKQGSSSSLISNSQNNQIKVAKLVLKPAPQSLSNNTRPTSPKKRDTFKTTLSHSATAQDAVRLSQNNNNKPADELSREPTVKKYQQTVELEKKTRKVEKEKETLNKPAHASGAENSAHKSNAMDEAARKEAREFMKKQREKRKLETKKEVDKSFVIKQRLDELRKTTSNVISKKPMKSKSPMKISPPKEFYSLNNLHMKEIKVLKLKPLSAGSHKSAAIDTMTPTKFNEARIDETFDTIKLPFTRHSPIKTASPVKTVSPVKKPATPDKKPASPLQLLNYQRLSKPDVTQRSRPTSSKENKKPDDDFKLRVPDVKLTMSTLNRTELVPSSYQPAQKIPFWLQNTAIQPYPYNFIWAVRKKLEAYTSAEEARQKAREKSQAVKNFETPHLKHNNQVKKGRRLPECLMKNPVDYKDELQRPTITDDSETTGKSMEQEIASEANTISEISSLQSDMALVKSKSQENERNEDDDDTTISESIFHSTRDDAFVGKERGNFYSDLSKNSFEHKIGNLAPENVSANTTEKRTNFFSSTVLPTLEKTEDKKTEPDDLENNKLNQEKEEEYQKMLKAFNKSLSHVIEVNQMLSTVLSSKSSVTSSQTSETVKNYSSSFEKNVETETQKTSGDSNISEMIDNLVQKSQPPARPVEAQSESNSSINTFIEDSKSTTLKPVVGDVIEDPSIIYNEPAPAQELSSSSTKVTTTTTTTKIVQQKISIGKKEENENTLNESKLLDMFKQSESETSFSIADNNASFGMLMEKSSSEIKSWERTLTERTRGQVAWLELQKINFRKHGQQDKASAIKKQQRAILLRLEKERSRLKGKSEGSLIVVQKEQNTSIAVVDMTFDVSANDSEARENIERILHEREQKLVKRRKQVEHLINWQRKLDKEEEKLKHIEKDLLGTNMKKLSLSPKKKKTGDDILNTSIEKVKSIDKSLKILKNIEPSLEAETVEVSGAKLNKLWCRLTGVDEKLYEPKEIYRLNKENFAQFYEEAKEVVLQSDLVKLLDSSVPEKEVEKPSEEKTFNEKRDDDSDVSTMNSIANIETEEEFPGSLPYEPETETITTTKTATENDDELQQILVNQTKVFLDYKIPETHITRPVNVTAQIETPAIDNATFQVQTKGSNELNESTSTVGAMEMDFEQDSLIQTEPLLSFDNSSVDADGFIIPEVNEMQITDMDHDENAQMIEDTSFPNLEITLSDESAQPVDDNVRNDLSTITECTEYEQSQGSGSSDDEISSEIVSHASTATTSERVNSEIEKRLISINDSLEEVNEAFNKIAIINRSPSTLTYSTDKDFLDSPKASSSESTVKTQSQNLLSFTPIGTNSSIESGSDMTTSTPKILMPDILSEVSGDKNDNEA